MKMTPPRPLLPLLVSLLSFSFSSTGFVSPRGNCHSGRLGRGFFVKKVASTKGGSKKKPASSGGGFGLKKAGPPPETKVGADKICFERQWDRFVAITDLEIMPQSDESDFEVLDVFVRAGSSAGARWFRVGKVTAEAGRAQAALKLQRGLIYWAAVQMYPALAVNGMKGAASLELGWTSPSLVMAAEEDGPLEVEEEGMDIKLAATDASVKDVAIPAIGFRPDFNPRGFAYKRRERAGADNEKKKRREREAAEAFDRGDDGSFDPFSE